MIPSSPEMIKMLEFVNKDDYMGVETYTYNLLENVSEESLFLDAWVNDGRREAIRFGLSILYSDPLNVTDVGEIMNFLNSAHEFIEFLMCVETNYGLEGWTNIFNSVANTHYIDSVLDFNILDFFEETISSLSPLENNSKNMSLNDFMKDDNIFAVVDIPNVDDAWKDMVTSGNNMFGENFESDWE
jgi:hypothetical protein